MNDEMQQRHTHLFTVRIWLDEPAAWRGKAQHVSSGAWRYFRNWDELTTFLQSTAFPQINAAEPESETYASQ
jgi:hypothetical protein